MDVVKVYKLIQCIKYILYKKLYNINIDIENKMQ